MAHVLWISLETPDRYGSGGQRRQYHQVRALKDLGHNFTVMVPTSQQNDASLREICSVVRPRLTIRGRAIPGSVRRMHRVINDSKWDAIIVAHDDSVSLLPARGSLRTPVLLEMQNVMSHWHRRLGRMDEFEIALAREAEAIRFVDAVSTCSSLECQRLVEVHPDVARVSFPAPSGIDVTEWPPAKFDRDEPMVAMFGSWDWDPNAAGLRWFSQEVWPRVSELVPVARALVAGSGVRESRDWPAGMTFLGRVADLPAFVAQATVVAVPVLDGVGASVKFAEALASGASVISTPDGANAFRETPAFVSADPSEWAQWIAQRVLQRANEPVPAEGRAFAFRELTWSRGVMPIDAWLRDVTSRPPAGDAST